MARVVAIEWDGREMRMVVGAVGGGSITLDHILSENFAGESSGEQMDPALLTKSIQAMAAKADVHGGEILVGVARSRVELRNMALPKADAEELPDMVRFTALRQFANVGDNWPIDFAPMPASETATDGSKVGEASDSQEVVAMTISPTTIAQIRKACSDAGFTVTQIGLRPMASGTLAASVSNSPVGSNSTVLLIDILSDEADMVVLEKGYVSFMRTVRLPGGVDTPRGPLPIGEIRRTMIAAVNARPGLKIGRIILWSDAASAKSSLESWQPNLDVPVEAIDPLSLIELRRSAERPPDTGRFAPLIGLLLQRKLAPKAVPANTFIDFLHPRQRPEKKKPYRQYGLSAAAAILLIGGSLWWYRSAHQALDSRIQQLTQELASLDPSLKLAQKNSEHWKYVEKFMAGNIQWLDELSQISIRALPAEQLVVGDTTLALNLQNNTGEIKSRVEITDQSLVSKMEDNFKDRNRPVGVKNVSKNPDSKSAYRWVVEPIITIPPSKVIDPTTLPPPKELPKESPMESPTPRMENTEESAPSEEGVRT